MTGALIGELAQIAELRVISLTSAMQYKRARKPLPQIARELNVDALIEGTVQRSGNRVRISAQLIEAATDRHLWRRERIQFLGSFALRQSLIQPAHGYQMLGEPMARLNSLSAASQSHS